MAFLSVYQNMPSGRFIAGDVRFLTLIQCLRSAGAIRLVLVLRYDALKAQQAGMPEQVWADLALFEVGEEDAIDTPVRSLARLFLRR